MLLFILMLVAVSAQSKDMTPYGKRGWDLPEFQTDYYKFDIFKLLSNPGGRSNINMRRIDSLFNALIVFTKPGQLRIEQDILTGKQTLAIDPMLMDTIRNGGSGGGFTNPMTTSQDIIVGGTAGAAGRLAKGSNYSALRINGSGNIEWATLPQSLWSLTNPLNNPMTTANDMIIGGTSGAPTRLPKGTANQVLQMNADATAITWGAGGGGGGFANPMTSAGDLIFGGSGGSAIRRAIGAQDFILASHGGSPTWRSKADLRLLTNPFTATGDIAYWNQGTEEYTKLPIGTAGQVLKVNSSGIPVWGTDATGSGAGMMYNPMYAAGQLITSGLSGTPVEIAAPANTGAGQYLGFNFTSGVPEWRSLLGMGYIQNNMINKGDMMSLGSVGLMYRIPAGATGQVLKMGQDGNPQWGTDVSGASSQNTTPETTPHTFAGIGMPVAIGSFRQGSITPSSFRNKITGKNNALPPDFGGGSFETYFNRSTVITPYNSTTSNNNEGKNWYSWYGMGFSNDSIKVTRAGLYKITVTLDVDFEVDSMKVYFGIVKTPGAIHGNSQAQFYNAMTSYGVTLQAGRNYTGTITALLTFDVNDRITVEFQNFTNYTGGISPFDNIYLRNMLITIHEVR